MTKRPIKKKSNTARKLKANVKLGAKVPPRDYSLSVRTSDTRILLEGERVDQREAIRSVVTYLGSPTNKSVVVKHGTKSNHIELSLSARDATRLIRQLTAALDEVLKVHELTFERMKRSTDELESP